eukprot:TRINITY_DN51587_c0_g1_i1.p1 TRINITY_DN51587_c0_g1~~TRINITY_DN51587_c0_g1_i1.p1  ORF type:complete len:403 (-),score=46.96 TRINITY_DN51587_c0_g1_i1:16-1224(-)
MGRNGSPVVGERSSSGQAQSGSVGSPRSIGATHSPRNLWQCPSPRRLVERDSDAFHEVVASGAVVLAPPEQATAERSPGIGCFHPGARDMPLEMRDAVCRPHWPHTIPGRSTDLSQVPVHYPSKKHGGAPLEICKRTSVILVEGAGSKHVNGFYTRRSPTLFTKDENISDVRLRFAGAWYFEHVRGLKGIYYAVGTPYDVPETGWHRWDTGFSAPGDLPAPTVRLLDAEEDPFPARAALSGAALATSASSSRRKKDVMAQSLASKGPFGLRSELGEGLRIQVMEGRPRAGSASCSALGQKSPGMTLQGGPPWMKSMPELGQQATPSHEFLDARQPRGLPAAFRPEDGRDDAYVQPPLNDGPARLLLSVHQGNIKKPPARRMLRPINKVSGFTGLPSKAVAGQ